MPGAFSSDSRTRVTTTSQAFNTGFSEIGGPATSLNLSLVGAKVGKHGALAPVINLTDQGALNAAMELSSQSIRGIDLLGSRLEASFSAAVDAVQQAGRSETETIAMAAIKWGALIAAAYLAARAFGVLK